MRRVLRRVVDSLLGDANLCIRGRVVPGIEVSVEMREVAARDVYSDAVPQLEYEAGREHLNPNAIDGPWFHELRSRPRFIPIAHPEDALGEVVGSSVGVHID